MPPVTMIVIGAGGRGSGYAAYVAEHPEEGTVIGVAEPRDLYRSRLAEAHDIPPENVFTDWTAVAERPRLAGAVLETHMMVFAAEKARKEAAVVKLQL